MAEDDKLEPFERAAESIEKLEPFKNAANSIEGTSWDREKQTPEFRALHDDLEALCQKVGGRKPHFTLTEAGPIADMAYEVTFGLLYAAREVLIDPDVIADPRPREETNFGRKTVLSKLAQVMEELHITPEDLADAHAKEKERRAKNPRPEWPWPGPPKRDTMG